MGEAVTSEGLRRRFGDLWAVDGVDLAVQTGEIYGFLGPNGAGKSTLVRMLTTLLSPTEGRGTVAGYDIASQAEDVRLRIGVALQEAALDAKQTGIEILRLQGRLYGLRPDEIDQRIGAIRGLVDIGDALDRPVGTYSGGMARRLDLAASLVHNPDVLFLDEPTTGLDPISRVRVWDEVRRLNDELGMTIFLTTQYLEEADTLADRVGIIDQGKLVAEGTPGELKRQVGDDVIVARVHDPEAGALERAVARLAERGHTEVHDDEVIVATANGASMISRVAVELADAGVDIRDLTLRTPTLDDVFLELTGNRIREKADA